MWPNEEDPVDLLPISADETGMLEEEDDPFNLIVFADEAGRLEEDPIGIDPVDLTILADKVAFPVL